MMGNNIPEELVIEILARLPVKTLFQFKCVSKSWYAMINDPFFIAKQLEWSNSICKKTRVKLIVQNQYSKLPPTISLISIRDEPCVVKDIESPFPKNNVSNISVLGHCNGIFCLFGHHFGPRGSVILWNPATKEVKPIPSSGIVPEPDEDFSRFGFGFDPITKDYKVVRVSHLWPLTEDLPLLVEVYNLSTGSWRTINVEVPKKLHPFRTWSLCLNGVYHWLTLAQNDDGTGDYDTILSFDFSKEVFKKMYLLPPGICAYFVQMIVAVGETLACFAVSNNPVRKFEIWLNMNNGVDNSWSKKFEIGPIPGCECISLKLGSRHELLLEENDGEFITYNDLPDHQMGDVHRLKLTWMFDYMETLVPLTQRGIHN